MRPEVEALLKPLVDCLNDPDREDVARNLWDILTALRGPDTGNEELKIRTTARLRYAIGIRQYPDNVFADFAMNGKALLSADPLDYGYGSGHFSDHYNKAVAAVIGR